LTARHLFVRYLADQGVDRQRTVVVAPDVGRAKPAARFAAQLGVQVAAAYKDRISDKNVKFNEPLLERQVQGYTRAIIYDDEIATGTTVVELCSLLVKFGIRDVIAICTHGLFTEQALDNITVIPELSQIITTDTVPIPPEKQTGKLRILSVAPVFGEAILRNYNRQSIGDLFSFS
jgi:ribose-phosphate pyrophosphokinase